MMIKNNIENLGEILFNAPIYPSLSSAPTITPNNGKPIPVRTNAKMAGQKIDHYQSEIREKLDCLRQKHSEERKPNDPCIFIHRVTPF